jgi:hypothetical protein
MRSSVERALFGSSAPITLAEFNRMRDIEPLEPEPLTGYAYRVTVDGGSCKIYLRYDGYWTAGKGDPVFDSRDDCAFRAARLNGLLD